jgi:hypothetical protein
VIGDTSNEVFDDYPTVPVKVRYNFITKISTFVMIVALIVINIINYIFIPHLDLYIPLSLGVVCAWLIVNIGFQKRKNIPKNIMYEAIVSMLLCIIWDKVTGWIGWSIDYVLPVTSAALVVFYFVMGIADRTRRSTYVAYLVLSEIGIIVSAVLLFTDTLCGVSRYISGISVGVGAALLIAQMIFRGKSFFSELYRWLHM